MQVRQLSRNDSQAYLALRRTLIEEFPILTSQEIARELAFIVRFGGDVLGNHALEGTRVWGAFDDERLLGAVCATRAFERSRMHEIRVWGLYVYPEHRGIGTGTALMQAALAWSRRQPMAVEAVGHASLGNRRALRMIRRCGFEMHTDDVLDRTGLCAMRLDIGGLRVRHGNAHGPS